MNLETSRSAARRALRAGAGGTAGRGQQNAFIAAFLGWSLDGFETYTAVLVGHQVVANLVSPTASALYFAGILAVTLASWACGGLISGVLADYLGRRRVLMLSILWYAVFTGLTALAPSYGIFIFFRFLTGLGMGAEWGPGSALVAELWSDRSRGRGVALLQGGFGVGFLAATGVWTFLDTGPGSWRAMFLIGVIPALVVAFIYRYVRDPQLWVEAAGRRQAARQRERDGGALSDGDQALTRFTVAHLLGDSQLRRRLGRLLILATATLGGWWAVSTWVPQYAAGLALAHGGNPVTAANSIALWYNIGGILGYFSMGFLNDWAGRKITLWGYFLGALVMNVVLFGFSSGPALSWAAAVNGFFTLGMITWLATWPIELFPTHARGTAISIVFNATRFLVAGATLLSGYLVDVLGSVSTAALVIGCIYVFGLLFTFWAGPETRGRPLPD